MLEAVIPRRFNTRRSLILAWVICLTLMPLRGITALGQGATSSVAAQFDANAASRAYLERPSAKEKARSDAYFEGGYWLQLWQFLYGAGVSVLLLQTRLSARMRDLSCRLVRFKPLQSCLYTVQYIVLTSLLVFPLSVYSDFLREHQYGLATQNFGGWLGDWLKALVVSVIIGCVIFTSLFGVVRRLPRTWHILGAIVMVGFLVVLIVLSPVFIAPLFNKYTALEKPAVVEPILRLARANGIHADKIYQFDASRQSKRVSANVSGFLSTMRISLNDNLLNRCSLPEIKAVMGHEMGHYVLNHVYKGLLFFGLVIVAGFAFLHWALGILLARFGARWGISGVGDLAVVPLAALLLSTFMFVLTPVTNSFTRMQEAEADIFGLNASREPDGFAEAALKLGEYRKMQPGLVEEWIFYDHPSGATRIRTAMQWKAENLATSAGSR
jgi:STE24 endopeptidase